MYRTLLATCGSTEVDSLYKRDSLCGNSSEPHVASNVRYIALPLSRLSSQQPKAAMKLGREATVET